MPFTNSRHISLYFAILLAATGFVAAFMVSGSAASRSSCREHPDRCLTTTTTPRTTTTTQTTTTTPETTTTPTTTTTPVTTTTATTTTTKTTPTTTTTTTTTSTPPTAPMPVTFGAGFESGTYKPWLTPEAANYGQPPSPTRTFGNFYLDTSVAGAGTTSGRFDLPADSSKLTRCEVLTNRSVGVGTDDYYSLMVYLPNGWTPGTSSFWGVEIAQLNLQNLGPGGPTIALQAHSDHITLVMQTGIASATSKPAYQYQSNADNTTGSYLNLPALYAVPKGMQLGVWHELVIHVHWATDSTGQVEVWHRVKGTTAWTKTVSLSGYPTLQMNPDGSVPTGTLDKIGAYRAQSTAPVSVWLDGFTRSGSFTAAASNLP